MQYREGLNLMPTAISQRTLALVSSTPEGFLFGVALCSLLERLFCEQEKGKEMKGCIKDVLDARADHMLSQF